MLHKHPELLDGPNPLFDGLSPYFAYADLPTMLEREPLAKLDWKSIDPGRRESLLERHVDHFTPTHPSIQIAAAIQNGLRAGLRRRNPLQQCEQVRINRIATLTDPVSRQAALPLALPASGGCVWAETGGGKSTILHRALEIFAPEQFIHHGPSAACGWSTLTQVYYLYVDLPSNGSRGGLMIRILGALDALLTTNYVDTLRKLRNADQALMLVIRMLSIHRVGLLVLDEGQLENFEQNPWQREFVLFFLALLNLGIPIILSGQPGAFTTLRRNAQVMRRFSQIGCFSLERAVTGNESWWKNALIPGVMDFNLCEEVRDVSTIQESAKKRSGGITGLFVSRWIEAQRIALRRGGETAVLKPHDFEAAGASPAFVELQRMVGWIEEPIIGEEQFTDLTPGAPSKSPSTDAATPVTATPGSGRNEGTRALNKLRKDEKRDATVAKKALEKEKKVVESLDPSDLRNSNRSLEILAGLESEVQKKLKLGNEY